MRRIRTTYSPLIMASWRLRHDLFVTRARAAAGTEGAIDLDALFRARTRLGIVEYPGIALFHAAPLLSPQHERGLVASGVTRCLAGVR